MRVSWQVICEETVDQVEVRKLLAKHKAVALQPNKVNRTMTRNGLLVHRDAEICFVTIGPDDLAVRLKGNSLINDVLPSPVVRI